MDTPTLIGVPAPGGAYTARCLRHGEHPAVLVPLLRRIWTGTFGRDTAAMAAGLLATDWSDLTLHGGPGRLRPIAGLDHPTLHGTPAPRHGRLDEHLDGLFEWLYLLHDQWQAVVVYEATVHSRWLRHGVYHLDPVDDLFVTETDPHDPATPAMTVCTVCGAVDEIDQQEAPSMAGYGEDTWTTCLRCGSSVTTDPMFGVHVTRRPWPPPPAP